MWVQHTPINVPPQWSYKMGERGKGEEEEEEGNLV
jgi:hypothetical protein